MVVLLSGGFSTQLKKYVGDSALNNPLWSSHFLASNPEAVVNTHCDYIEAGCEVLTTDTYQASVEGFHHYLQLDLPKSKALFKEAVSLARKAILKVAKGRNVLVAGSVGPYGACLLDGSEYRGDYIDRLTSAELTAWHRPRVSALVEAGVDLLAIETIPATVEAVAILQLLKDEFPQQKAWVSFSCKDEQHISVGEPLSDAVAECCRVNSSQLVAVGVNCLSPTLVSPLLSSLQDRKVPFIVYPNSGETWTPGVGWTNKEACLPLVNYLPEWLSLGAQYVGGCCQTTAEDMRLCRQYLDTHCQ